jgi:murein tripeptide amidase MpaA
VGFGQVVEYIAYNLLVQYGSDTVVRAILDSYDFYILPFVNPDGKIKLSPPLFDKSED